MQRQYFLDFLELEVKLIRRELKKIKELRPFDNDNLLNLASMISGDRIPSTKGEQKDPEQILIILHKFIICDFFKGLKLQCK